MDKNDRDCNTSASIFLLWLVEITHMLLNHFQRKGILIDSAPIVDLFFLLSVKIIQIKNIYFIYWVFHLDQSFG